MFSPGSRINPIYHISGKKTTGTFSKQQLHLTKFFRRKIRTSKKNPRSGSISLIFGNACCGFRTDSKVKQACRQISAGLTTGIARKGEHLRQNEFCCCHRPVPGFPQVNPAKPERGRTKSGILGGKTGNRGRKILKKSPKCAEISKKPLKWICKE
jgi:hypothetical protein